MSTATIETVTRMLESLPQSVQDRAVEHLREYLEDVTDEIRWDENFERTADKLAEAAKIAREQFEKGKTADFDLDKL